MKQKLTLLMAALLLLGAILLINLNAWSFEKPSPSRIPADQILAPFFLEREKDATLCIIQNDDGSPGYYFNEFDLGMGFAVYMDPAKCGLPDPYPFKITDVHFYLYDWGNCTWPVEIQVNIRDVSGGNKCNGPASLVYSESFTIPSGSAYPNIINLSLSQSTRVMQPFFVELIYQTPGGTLPSLLMDESVTSTDTCNNWSKEGGQYYEWSDFWGPPLPGDAIIRATGYAEASMFANFSAQPESGFVPLQVQFTDLSIGNPTSWLWNFGDDSTSTDPNPIHMYNDIGYFDVKLVVSNATETDSVIKHNYIHAYGVGHLAGFVRDTLGQPIYPAEVKLFELPETTSTDPSGYFKFTNLNPGNYTLSVRASNYATFETTGVVVAYQETTWVNVTLKPKYFSVCNYPTIEEMASWTVETGDFNGDNNVDLISISLWTEGAITRLWGHGDGTFSLQPPIPVQGNMCVDVKGYFNSDDFLDLAVANEESIEILLNDGSGNFLPPRVFNLHGDWARYITKGYLNSDPHLDLVTANLLSVNLSIFRGVGNGDFVFVKNLDIPFYHVDISNDFSVDMGDFNNDGNTDLVVGTDSLAVFLGDGNWNFTRSFTTYFHHIASVTTMNSLADFNKDGNLDMIFATPAEWSYDTSYIAVLLGDGLGGFPSITLYSTPYNGVRALVAGDFNGDNNLDFAANYPGFHAVKVYLGDGAGNFPNRILNDIGKGALSIASGDFNKDGNADIVAGWDSITVLLNLNPPKPTIEDEFVLTGYTSVNLAVTDPYGSTANILANTIAGADYYQKDCDLDSSLDDRVYNFNAFPGRYLVGVTPRPGSEPGGPASLGIRIDGTEVCVMVAKSNAMNGLRATSKDTVFFIVTDSLPILCLPANPACFCKDTLDTLTFFWNQIEGTSQYHFQLDDTIDFSSPVIDDPAVTDTSFSLTSPLSAKKYYWRVRANGGVWSVFSETYSLFPHLCGDMNGNCKTDVVDVVHLINYLFISGPEPVCILSADVNRDGKIDVTDVVYLINYLFIGGPPPSC